MKVLDLGRQPYEETWRLQRELLETRARGESEDTLVLVEHWPVYTRGRSSVTSPPAAQASICVPGLGAVSIRDVERGGQLTFHGPGQLVGYPIFALPHRDLRRYLRDVERVLIDALKEVTGLPAQPCPQTLQLEPGQLQTGVWVGDLKIASIGIAVRKWVTYHGFALNLSTDLRYFQGISPCGFSGTVMSSVQALLGQDDAENLAAMESRLRGRIVEGFRRVSEQYGRGPVDEALPAPVQDF